MKREQKTLPINKDTYICSGMTRAGLLAIMTSEEYVGRTNAVFLKFLVTEGDDAYDYFPKEEGFRERIQNMELLKEEKKLSAYSEPCMERKYAYLYHPVKFPQESDISIEVCLDYLQDSHAWSYVKLLFSDGIRRYDEAGGEAGFGHACSLMLTSKGKLVFQYGHVYKCVQLNYEGSGQSIWLRITVNRLIEAFYSFDGEEWVQISKTRSKMQGRMQAGLYINPQVNPFFYEYYVTQLQMCYNKVLHLLMPQTEMDEENFGSMLEVYRMPREVLPASGEELIAYFMELILKRYYICLQLDEYYVPQRDFYQKQNLAHLNYIYGFDRTRRVFQLMGFHEQVIFSEVGFEEFMQASQLDKGVTDKIILCKYNSKKEPDHLDKDIMIRVMRAYMFGTSCYAVAGQKIIYHGKDESMLYGVGILQYLAESEEDLQVLIQDIRLSQQIQEHYVNMCSLLEMLFSTQMLQGRSYTEYRDIFQKLQQLSESLRNMLLENKMNPMPDIEDRARMILQEMYAEDIHAMGGLILELEE